MQDHTYESFRMLCKNLNSETTETTIVRMFRDTWAQGGGEITPKAFFTQANESGFLRQCLRVKGEWKSPPLTTLGEIDTRVSPHTALMSAVYVDWKRS